MDANARRGRSGGRTLAVGLLVVALVAVVAIASGGSTPQGTIGAHRPSEALLDAMVSLFLVAMAIGAVLVAVMVSFFSRYEPGGTGRKRRGPVRSLIVFLVALGLIALIVRALAGSVGPRLRPPETPAAGAGSGAAGLGSQGYEPRFVLWPVLAVGALGALALVAWWMTARGRRSVGEPTPATPEEALADVLAATLDDLRAERDPRRAVIAAYARMERTLAASGLARASAEAPEEYLERVVAEVALSRRAAARLTSLFAWARFSGHDVRPEMKDEAIETLEQVQRELAAADAARQAELAGTAA